MKTALCVGNGESRLNVNLDAFDDVGPMYGCNAIYRDQNVDNVISTNQNIVEELIKNKGHTRCNFYTCKKWERYYKRYPEVKYLPDVLNTYEYKAGIAALYLAAEQKADIIIMLGYDLYNPLNTINNVYKDTDHYPISSLASSTVNDADSFRFIFESFPDVQFVQIQDDNWTPPDSWLEYTNVVYDTLGSLSLLTSA